MQKSFYILLTVTATFIVLFLLGNWVGRSFGLNKQQVIRSIHESYCRATDAYQADTTQNLSTLFRRELNDAGVERIKFRLDTISLESSTDTIFLRENLPYFSDYRKLIENHYTFVYPIGEAQGVHARILNFRAEFIGRLLYYFFGTILALVVLLYGIRKQIDIIHRQDELAQMREDFSYAMIHDMKNPISSISMGLKVLRSGKVGNKPGEQERHFDILESESQHLLALTNKVLAISKLEHEELLLEKDWIELRPLLETLVDTFTAKAEKPISFTLRLEEAGVYADEEYLMEAVSNLIDNAIKYSKDTIEIQISSSLNNGYTQIKVRDNGIGIPLAAQRTIFDKFERVVSKSKGSAKKVSGFGLGLNYVMNVTRAHGGYVSVESKEGRYSEFTLSLPLPPEVEGDS